MSARSKVCRSRFNPNFCLNGQSRDLPSVVYLTSVRYVNECAYCGWLKDTGTDRRVCSARSWPAGPSTQQPPFWWADLETSPGYDFRSEATLDRARRSYTLGKFPKKPVGLGNCRF